MSNPHNHLPRCCCLTPHEIMARNMDEAGRPTECPACPEHGELAPIVVCPQCHQEAGRPHTDFCTLAPGRVWDGTMPAATITEAGGSGYALVPIPCSRPGSNRGDGRGCSDPACPRHGEPDEPGPIFCTKPGCGHGYAADCTTRDCGHTHP